MDKLVLFMMNIHWNVVRPIVIPAIKINSGMLAANASNASNSLS